MSDNYQVMTDSLYKNVSDEFDERSSPVELEYDLVTTSNSSPYRRTPYSFRSAFRLMSYVKRYMKRKQEEADAAARIGPTRKSEDEVRVRYLNCPSYSLCLDYAVACLYRSFSCEGCSLARAHYQPFRIVPIAECDSAN